jgi:hypothetical protein
MRKFIAAAVLAASTLTGLAVAADVSGAAPADRNDRHDRDGDDLEVVGLAGRRLITFDADRPERVDDVGRIRGLDVDTRLVGIDYRAATGDLYGLGDQGGIYVVDEDSARASLVGRITVALRGTSFGVDFNPAADRLRVVSDQGQNLRINVADATTTVDGDLNYTAGTPAGGIVGAAYTNNDRDPNTATTLFDVDSAMDQIAVQSPPNAGSLVATGRLGVDTGAAVGVDIYSEIRQGTTVSNTAFAALGGDRSSFFSVDLLTGHVDRVGRFPSDLQVTGIAIPLGQ